MTLKQIDKLFSSTVNWKPPKRSIILMKSSRQCFNARSFSSRTDIDFSHSYNVLSNEPKELCGIKGTYIIKK